MNLIYILFALIKEASNNFHVDEFNFVRTTSLFKYSPIAPLIMYKLQRSPFQFNTQEKEAPCLKEKQKIFLELENNTQVVFSNLLQLFYTTVWIIGMLSSHHSWRRVVIG
jgi:hypothetical protein